ncbi:sorting nexin-17-like [Corticium candelabrum]|uniref:sorting nexin-17-like n=1 Tax=Corticium candelabrum TaxID=121492 RepID=UPI002E26D05D|nr:sorting nexin-17-like [Corticium candelabrum]
MHFSIPDTSEVEDETGRFTTYNIYTNGAFHCSVRYSQLHEFSEKVKQEFGTDGLTPFPSKKLKFLKLTPAEMEGRREMLEKFIQSVSQVPHIAKSNLFTGFFLSAQQEAAQQEAEAVTIDIYLPNGNKQSVDIMSTDQTEDVLETFCSKIKLPDEFVYYFGLFLMKTHEDGSEELVRKVQDFESPYISLRDLPQEQYCIVLRKWYWDPVYDEDLMGSSIALNLLFVQAVHDVEAGWIQTSKQEQRQLSGLKTKKSRKEYIQLVRTFKHYNYIQILPCLADFPIEGVKASVSLGPSELCLEVATKTGDIKEFNFLVTRMRCWKVVSCGDRLELSFDYLFNKDKLKWVKIKGSQAIFISVCLQGLVDELIMKRDNKSFKQPGDRQRTRRSLEFRKRTVLSTASFTPPVEITEDTTSSAAAVSEEQVVVDGKTHSEHDNGSQREKPFAETSDSKVHDDNSSDVSAVAATISIPNEESTVMHSERSSLSQLNNDEKLTSKGKKFSTKVSGKFTKSKSPTTPSHTNIELDKMNESKVFADIGDEDL